ncbi:MAG: ornithine cyclodeaminase family protein [Rhodospirillales bacterium]|nr:ornithine cyclodeaminase family protein [Rhodospirillales bacterium]
MLVLDEKRVRAAITVADLIPVMERALIDFSAGRVVQPTRQMLEVPDRGGLFAPMPVIMDDVIGVKALTYYPGNAVRGIPTHHAQILLFRADTGEPLATIDGRLITEMRTAAVSAAATKAMAATDARVLAILGSGVQARSHFEALRLVREFAEVRVWSPTAAHVQRFADATGARVAASAADAAADADVIVTATAATRPVLAGAWLKAGAHVNAIGAPRPAWRELDDAAMGNLLVVDSRQAALRESGDVILSNATIAAELGEVLAGHKIVKRGWLSSEPGAERTRVPCGYEMWCGRRALRSRVGGSRRFFDRPPKAALGWSYRVDTRACGVSSHACRKTEFGLLVQESANSRAGKSVAAPGNDWPGVSRTKTYLATASRGGCHPRNRTGGHSHPPREDLDGERPKAF